MTVTYDTPILYKKDVIFLGPVSFAGEMEVATGSVEDNSVKSNADIATTKLQHRNSFVYNQPPGTDIVSETELFRIAKSTGEIVSVKIRPAAVPATGDKQYTVDIQKAANGSDVWVSQLTSVLTISSVDAAHTIQEGILIATPSYVENEVFRIVITASGSTGTQGQGLLVEVIFDESGIG